MSNSDISFFHDFVPPPAGGGHQFLRALWREFERRGIRLEHNTVSKTTRACLFNSFNFNFKRLCQLRRPGCRMIHRVDGPLAVYRGFDDGTDRKIFELNQEIADVTILQSQFSLTKHLELGFDFVQPVVIPNAADLEIFHSRGRQPFNVDRKIRLISVSWSDNLNKGAPVYQWLDDHLDWGRYEYTFVGRSSVSFHNIRMLSPITSEELAKELRQNDVFITASRNDPCSNSLIEALACGLPALYLGSGGHSEIVGEAGFAFQSAEEIPQLLSRLIADYSQRQALIRLPSIAETADKYLRVMRGTLK
ncbi:MAG: glycosyltransferase family 4 protein [Chloroflexi bacterium]|nr:glycosyltransferase family 4 protein [Chloroflexota bacterium]